MYKAVLWRSLHLDLKRLAVPLKEKESKSHGKREQGPVAKKGTTFIARF